MADKIKVSGAEMLATINRYNQSMNTMQQAQKSMNSALHHLDNCWKGAAWAAMMYKWTQIEANIVKSELAVQRSIVALQNSNLLYDEGEEANKTTGSGLEIGTATTIYV